MDELIKRIDQAGRATIPTPRNTALWPGPNSNTFTAWIARAVPELEVDLPATAIGKDYLGGRDVRHARRAAAASSSRSPACSAWRRARVDGLELNLLGLNFGVSPSGLKLPLVGRIGTPRIDTALAMVYSLA